MNPPCFLVLSCALLAGCASTPESHRITPGKVALVTAQYAPAAEFNAYAAGTGANAARQAGRTGLKGAKGGALPGALVMQLGKIGGPPGAFFAAVGLVVAGAGAAVGGTIGGVVGAIDGAVNAMPTEERKTIHHLIDQTRLAEGLQSELSRQVLAHTASLPRYRVLAVPQAGPRAPREMPEYGHLRAAGFDSVLELAVVSIGFQGEPGDPPIASFEMTVRARAVPLAEGSEPWIVEKSYRGVRRMPATEWQADDGRLFREELEASYQQLTPLVAWAVFNP